MNTLKAGASDPTILTLPEAEADAAARPIAAINPNDPALFAAGLTAPYFARLRRDAPIHYTAASKDGPFWSVTRHADIQAIESDHARFSSEASLGGIMIDGVADPAAMPMFIAMDPPRDEARRRTVAPAFSSARLQALEPRIRARAGAILDTLPVGEPFDWAATVAPDIASMTLATLFDFPLEERHRLTRWSDVATAEPGGGIIDSIAERVAEFGQCLAAFDALWVERATEAPRDDLISMLAHAPATRDMPLAELQGNIILLIVGGHDTTRHTLSASIREVAAIPGLYARLRADRSLLPAMITEAIRWQTPLAHMRRTARVDITYGGQRIARGDKVVLWYISANRDEAAIPDADRFNIDRAPPARHLAFGHGIHRCIGARFAEMALQIVWEEMLDRFDGIELVGEPMRTSSTFVNGYREMAVKLKTAR